MDDVLAPAFEQREDGLPRFSLLYYELGRGQWKTGAAAAIALTEAVLGLDTDVVVCAADIDQASILVQSLDGYLDRDPGLDSLCTRKGWERTFPQSGSRIRVLSSDAASSWGLGGVKRRFRVIADELTMWRDESLWTSLISATGKTKDSQSIILSNAGFDAGRGWQWRIRETARTRPWAHLYAPEGIIASWVSEAWIEQQRALLPPAAFARVILNQWISESGDFVSSEQWARCVDERLAVGRPTRGVRHFGGLDLGLVKDRTAFAIAHRSGQHILLDEMTVWQGSRDQPVSISLIEENLLSAARRYSGFKVLVDPWQLKGSIERLRPHMLIDEFTFSGPSVQRLSATLLHAITSQTLRVPPDELLTREILGLRVIESATGWRLDHRAGGYSDRAIALALAVLGATPTTGQGKTSRPRGRLPGRLGRTERPADPLLPL